MAEPDASLLRVLVADDSATVRRFLSDAMSSFPEPVEIQEAEDGLACHHHLASGYFDVAFVDVNMPEMDGLAAVAKARADGVETFTAVMSTETDQAKLTSARKLHAYEYLTKPFDVADVHTILRNYRRLQVISKVLVVDDSSTTRAIIRKVLDLSFLKFAFYEASDGESALDLLRREPFDIVFLDVNMPGISGVDMLFDLRRHNPDVDVIMITTDCDRDISELVAPFGVEHILYKPFFREDVDRLLHDLFGLRVPELNSGAEAMFV